VPTCSHFGSFYKKLKGHTALFGEKDRDSTIYVNRVARERL